MVVFFPHGDHSDECQEERVCVCGEGVLPIAGGQLFRRISFEFKRVPAGKWGQSLGKKALGLLRQECSGEEEEGG